ncbi:helix-turn-helix transcriptional regulator [Isoptericola halotolerans]|uniref:helix-turn-helix transcriptional regulator n=1 Tax=Isoptericola halotolerans TaxID=300560 RepID=UPI00389075FF
MDRIELGTLLRRSRERLAPADVGLPPGARRRTPGLRREEVAQLAGVSVDYVVRLEQGRGSHPSDQVLGALARALRLDADEQELLFRLAGSAPLPADVVDLSVRSSVRRIIDRLAEQPALVISAKGDILAWNAAASALFGDWSRLPVRERNIVRIRFLGTQAPVRLSAVAMTDEERAVTDVQAVASLRSTLAKYPRDVRVRELVDELRAGSEEFARLWESGATGHWRSHRKTIVHPALGPLTLDCDTLVYPDGDQSVVVYSAAPGTAEAEALSFLQVVGPTELGTVVG